ncbi:MAG: hypothetical protein ABIW33_09300 [Sphingomicrobium sp.]
MPLNPAWLELHRSRFEALPLDCGNDDSPGIVYTPEFRDWSDKATTPDQLRIERYIDRFALRSRRVLHVGIGNSGLAKRFSGRVGEIVGTTIDDTDIEVANRVAVPGYIFFIHNKYALIPRQLQGKFDFIVENNPTSACCCITHLARMFDNYLAVLAEDGQIVTDRLGLAWTPPDRNSRWGFDFDDLSALAAAIGLGAWRINRNTYVLSKSAPARPTASTALRSVLRRLARLPGRALNRGRRLVGRRA